MSPFQQQERYIYIPNLAGKQIVRITVQDCNKTVEDVTITTQPEPGFLSQRSASISSTSSIPYTSAPSSPDHV